MAMVIKYGKDVAVAGEWSLYEDKGEIYIGFVTEGPGEHEAKEVLVRMPAAQARALGKEITKTVDETAKPRLVE